MVKRFVVAKGVMRDDEHLQTGSPRYVLSSDYDTLEAELARYKETLSICQDRNARAHAETAAANARIRELEAERDEALRMENQAHERVAQLEADLAHSPLSSAPSPRYNRAMARIAVLETAISDHNNGCHASCGRSNEYNARSFGCESYLSRGMQCPNCPMDDLIEVPSALETHPYKTCVHGHNWNAGICPHCPAETVAKCRHERTVDGFCHICGTYGNGETAAGG